MNHQSLFIVSVDISGTFDKIVHSQALYSLLKTGVNLSVVKLLGYWQSLANVRIKWNNDVSNPISVRRGVRQGGVLSPNIFNFVLGGCLCSLSPSYFYKDLGISHIAYADDVLLVSRTRQGLINNLKKLSSALSKVGLSINNS